jgi:hypothetical protein
VRWMTAVLGHSCLTSGLVGRSEASQCFQTTTKAGSPPSRPTSCFVINTPVRLPSLQTLSLPITRQQGQEQGRGHATLRLASWQALRSRSRRRRNDPRGAGGQALLVIRRTSSCDFRCSELTTIGEARRRAFSTIPTIATVSALSLLGLLAVNL